MENKTKKPNSAITVILYIISVLFILYGAYMIYSSVTYVQNYDSYGVVSSANIIQYIVTSCASYFGFGIVIFAAAKIISILSKGQEVVVAEENAPVANEEPVLDEATEETVEETLIEDTEETASETEEVLTEIPAEEPEEVEEIELPDAEEPEEVEEIELPDVEEPEDVEEIELPDVEEPEKVEEPSDETAENDDKEHHTLSSAMIKNIFENK